jgi:hypothetical protein
MMEELVRRAHLGIPPDTKDTSCQPQLALARTIFCHDRGTLDVSIDLPSCKQANTAFTHPAYDFD